MGLGAVNPLPSGSERFETTPPSFLENWGASLVRYPKYLQSWAGTRGRSV